MPESKVAIGLSGGISQPSDMEVGDDDDDDSESALSTFTHRARLIFEMMDEDGDGQVTWQEIKRKLLAVSVLCLFVRCSMFDAKIALHFKQDELFRIQNRANHWL